MALILIGILAFVAVAAGLVRWTRWHPAAVVAALAVLLAVGVLVAMTTSVVTSAEAALITGTGVLLLGVALAAPGAWVGAVWRRRVSPRPVVVVPGAAVR